MKIENMGFDFHGRCPGYFLHTCYGAARPDALKVFRILPEQGAALEATLHPPASPSAQAADLTRPWDLAAAIALAYVAYTAYDGWHQPPRARSAAPTIESVPALPVVQPVMKCVKDGAITYSDQGCEPGTLRDVLLLPS